MKIILQNNESDCLLACYAMLLNNLGLEIPLYEIYKEDMIPADGLNVSYLMKLNKRFKVGIKAYRILLKDIAVCLDKSIPVILHWNDNHFVVLLKIRNKKYTIIDPAIGKITYSEEEVLKHYSGICVTVFKGAEFKRIKYSNLFVEQLRQTIRLKPAMYFILALGLTQAGVFLFSITIRNILDVKYSFIASLLMLMSVVVVQLISVLIKNETISEFNNDFDKNYVNKLFKMLLNKPLLYFRNLSNGILGEKINLKSTIRDSITLKLLPSIVGFISLFVVILYLLTISTKLTFILLILLIFYGIVSSVLYKKQNELNHAYLQYLIDFNSVLQTDLENIDFIKIARKEEQIFKSWKSSNNLVTDKYSSILKVENFSQFVGSTFNYISLSLILILGIYFKAYFEVSIPDLILYQTSVSLMISFFEQVKQSIFEIAKLQVYAEKQSDLFTNNASIEIPIDNEQSSVIRCDKVNFSYNNQKLYSGINLEILKGEKIAILGESGSGKSTLLLLLLGMLRYDGELTYGVSDFTSRIGVVLQNMTLVPDTILKNLDCAPSDEDLERILRDTGGERVIAKLPNKLFSKVLKSGKNLSGGQIQKLLISRSLLNKRDIIFWDEAFSNLDEKSKKKIYTDVLSNPFYSDKTMVIVSHQLDIVNYVDSIIFVDKSSGDVIKDTHDNLIYRNQNYRKLFGLKEEVHND